MRPFPADISQVEYLKIKYKYISMYIKQRYDAIPMKMYKLYNNYNVNFGSFRMFDEKNIERFFIHVLRFISYNYMGSISGVNRSEYGRTYYRVSCLGTQTVQAYLKPVHLYPSEANGRADIITKLITRRDTKYR